MPVIEDQITTPPAGIMPVMQVIEAQRASILVPRDHLHNNQKRTFLSVGCVSRDSIDEGRGHGRPLRRGVPAMRRGLLAGFGVLLTVAGVVWTLQGLGFIGGSVMTGVTLWAVVGPIAAVIGLAMAVTGLRRRAAG
jgi:hypothetical protein